jgi:NitT/TauT family transport system ATP-binding protein
MVRIIVGTAIDVSDGRRSPNCAEEIFSLNKRDLAGKTAPAKGLFLNKVFYNTDVKAYNLLKYINMYLTELSEYMRQRFALIRTLATCPDVLLLDEPFSALDYRTRLIVSDDVYKIIKNEGKSAILVTHDISEAISMSDKIIVITKRPASVKSLYTINLDITEERTPMVSRNASNFKDYFNILWKELDSYETK